MQRLLTPLEKFAIHSLLFYCNGEAIDLAYKITRRNETKTTDPKILHKMALRWLHDDKAINEYIKSLGYTPTTSTNGEKDFCLNIEDADLKV